MMEGARPVRNRRLTCDFCGEVPPVLYLPHRYNGVFCKGCLADVLNPPPKSQVRIWDGEPADDFVGIGKKMDAYLRKRREEPVFCGRGRPRKDVTPRKPAARVQPANRVTQSWRYFSRTDRVRITRSDAAFRGVRAIVWGLLRESDGASISEVLSRGKDAGLDESRVAGILRKMITVYGVMRVDRSA